MMRIRITVIFSPASREVIERELTLEAGATAAQAILASGVLTEPGGAHDMSGLTLGVWGRRCAQDQVLSDLDRVEVYRPLRVDPKLARRLRFARQGVRASGLFARKRPGAKAGY